MKRLQSGFTLVELITVMAIVFVLFGLAVAGAGHAKAAAYETQDLSALHQIGVAAAIYEEGPTPLLRTAPLVMNGLIPANLLTSHSDPTERGVANLFRSLTHAPDDPQTLYRDSYLPAAAICTEAGRKILYKTKGAGWLVAFSQTQWTVNPADDPLLEGSYLRLFFDGSVAKREHHIRHNFPDPKIPIFQDKNWWYTDEDMDFEPGYRP
jgi:prepilin-type N-terminal cleavage/methylation domain-containing protein